MEVMTIQKYIHTSPRKLRLVADMVRKMKPSRALVTLQFANKAAALPLKKALQTVLADAEQKKLQQETLAFKVLEINEGPKLARYHAGTKGRANPYRRKMSHIKIVLTDDSKVSAIKKGEK
ncbi:MAG: uL22 family ribosomal protein [bacterium]|nr:uL22 family ribosomal protein [bacterium]